MTSLPALAPENPRSATRRFFAALSHRLEFGDFIIFLYFAVFIRQYLWPADNQVFAWGATFALTCVLWVLHLRTKEPLEEKTPTSFWLIVALPLLAVYALRAALPDMSFDVLNYRLVSAERALRGFPFLAGDFLPTFYPLNPAPDMAYGILRHLAGYRLGTMLSYLALIWAALIIEKLLRPYLHRAWLRCAGVLLITFAEHMLFVVNTYLIDLLALPLLLEATARVLRLGQFAQPRANFIRVALLTGISVAFKISNLAFALPLLLLAARQLIAGGLWRDRRTALAVVLAGAAFAVPLLPHALYMYGETGNPIFPMFNSIFRSPYWPPVNHYDGRWGPRTLGEHVAWPVLVSLKPERTSELPVYSGRIPLVFVASIVGLLALWRDKQLRILCLLTIANSYLWSAGLTGYARYGSYVELLGGVTLLALAAAWWRATGARRWSFSLKRVAALLILVSLGAQVVMAAAYVRRYEWSMRPPLFAAPRVHAREARHLLRDRSLEAFLPDAERALLRQAEVWVESGYKASGVAVLLSPHTPMWCLFVNDYFYSATARERFARIVNEAAGKRVFALCLTADFNDCRHALTWRGLEVGRAIPVKIPFYSHRTSLDMLLIEVTPSPRDEQARAGM